MSACVVFAGLLKEETLYAKCLILFVEIKLAELLILSEILLFKNDVPGICLAFLY